jgi:imidazolonepropionase-like amidohydrolase
MASFARIGAAAATLTALLAAPAAAWQDTGSGAERADWVVTADSVYTATGEVLDGGTVVTAGGKITAVTPGARTGSSEHVLSAAAVTPGMIDLSVRITRGDPSVEQSREVTPEMRVEGGIDPFARAWERQARRGVTTALVNPPDFNVIGGLGVVVKTAGVGDPGDHVVRRDAVLRGSFGAQPSARNHPAFGRPTDHFSRRPTTRMGVEWPTNPPTNMAVPSSSSGSWRVRVQRRIRRRPTTMLERANARFPTALNSVDIEGTSNAIL